MKRILYLTFTIIFALTIFTAGAWAAEKTSAVSDKLLTQQQVDELLQDSKNQAAYVKIDEDAYKVYPALKDKNHSAKNCLKIFPLIRYFIF